MQNYASIITAILLILLLLAAVNDFYKHKVPNVVSLSGWLLAPLLHAIFFGLGGFIESINGLFLTLILTFPLYAFRWMGAGDVKLMVTVGAFVGYKAVPDVLIYIVVTGAFYSVLMFLIKRYSPLLLAGWRAKGYSPALLLRVGLTGETGSGDKLIIPYAVPIAIGTIAYTIF